ncbi:FCS-Like Zinc finger 8-like isoform X2 [Curcuma longa]|uniref:FCS-Like Zinc finger 8-like isoform X2 n=1 Tax=Curcuma longa TaxID=136217 RepID=UPI003D9F1A9C
MLRKKSRPVARKQGSLMSEKQSSSSSSPVNGGSTQSKPSPLSLFPSPRLFRSFSCKGFSDHESSMSPTSILETKHLCNSFGSLSISDRLQPKKPSFENGGSEPTGLGILDALAGDDKLEESSDAPPRRRMIVFGSQLKVQIPPPMALPTSPIEFGVKNRDSKLALFSPALRSSLGTEAPARETFSPRSISISEMERSEDYTCVISHGPNPKTTHIFDNCIVESCGDEFTATRKTAAALDILTDSGCHDQGKQKTTGA